MAQDQPEGKREALYLEALAETLSPVTPAQAGVEKSFKSLDSAYLR